MITQEEINKARAQFEQAAKDFGFRFYSPFTLSDTVSAFGFIEDYGSESGTIICFMSLSGDSLCDKDQLMLCRKWRDEIGCFYSFINPEMLQGDYKTSYFRAMLRDLGYFGKQRR